MKILNSTYRNLTHLMFLVIAVISISISFGSGCPDPNAAPANTPDGTYIIGGDNTQPVAGTNDMGAAVTGAANYGYKTKANLFTRIIFLKTGQNYFFQQYKSSAISRKIGGAVASTDSSYKNSNGALNTTATTLTYRVASTTDQSPIALTVPKDGYYWVYLDDSTTTKNTPTNSYYAVPITDISILGDATVGGWNADTKLTAPTAQTAGTDAVWSLDTKLVPGALKFRINSTWNLYSKDKKTDKSQFYDIMSNHGTTTANAAAPFQTQLGTLQPGGSNMAIASDAAIAGNYTLKFTVSSKGVVAITATRNSALTPIPYAVTKVTVTGDDASLGGWTATAGIELPLTATGAAASDGSTTYTYSKANVALPNLTGKSGFKITPLIGTNPTYVGVANSTVSGAKKSSITGTDNFLTTAAVTTTITVTIKYNPSIASSVYTVAFD